MGSRPPASRSTSSFEAQAAGVISVDYYDQLHAPPGRPSTRSYEAFKDDLGPRPAICCPAMFAAFGIAEPDRTSHLSVEDEAVIEDWATPHRRDRPRRPHAGDPPPVRRVDVVDRPWPPSRRMPQVIDQMGPEFAGVPSQEIYDRVFLPWAKAARTLPALAEWLTRHHMSRAIDDYSIGATEQVLADSGYVPHRPTAEPAVAFLDLTGFTRLTQERGRQRRRRDRASARRSRVAAVALTGGGRVVKLLGDGVLMHFPDLVDAVDASLELMERLGASDLPPGHVGLTQGPVVARDGDIFGRTVNLAARISDVAPSGELYLPASTGTALTGRFAVESVGAKTMPGVGTVELARVARLAS